MPSNLLVTLSISASHLFLHRWCFCWPSRTKKCRDTHTHHTFGWDLWEQHFSSFWLCTCFSNTFCVNRICFPSMSSIIKLHHSGIVATQSCKTVRCCKMLSKSWVNGVSQEKHMNTWRCTLGRRLQRHVKAGTRHNDQIPTAGSTWKPPRNIVQRLCDGKAHIARCRQHP
jgi:hypothetical protein